MLDKIVNFFERRQAKRFNGLLVFYMVYDPTKKGKNVLSHHIFPEMREDELLHRLLGDVADRVRHFYEENPEKLEEIKKALEEENEEL
jgi:hypothetical protein